MFRDAARPHAAPVLHRVSLDLKVRLGRRLGGDGHRVRHARSDHVNGELGALKAAPVAVDALIPGAAPDPAARMESRRLGVDVELALPSRPTGAPDRTTLRC